MKWWVWSPAAALVLLHLLVNLTWPWEQLSWVQAWASPNPDLTIVLAAGVVAVLAGMRASRLAVIGAVLLLLAPLWRFGATVMPAVYGKSFEPWDDLLLVPGLVHLLTHDLGAAQQILAGAGAVAGVVLAWYVAMRLLRHLLSAAAATPSLGLLLLLLLQSVTAVAWISESAMLGSPWRQGSAAGFVRELVRYFHTGQGRAAERFWERVAAAQREQTAAPQDLGRLAGADVHLLFLESYGRLLHREPVRAQVAAWARELERQLAATGHAVVSTYLFPSMRGGGSVLAHAEFLSGVQIGTFREHDWVLHSGLRPLPKLLQARGYHTVDVQPGMPRAWPEGMQFFGFAEEKFAPDLGYRGTPYHWGQMPDQYALARALAEEVLPAAQPLFVQFVSVTSHGPFAKIPPLLADWRAAADSQAFLGPPAQTFAIDWLSYANHPDLEAAYLAAIRYSLQVAVGYVQQLPRPALVLVLGDHQPPAAGRLSEQDPSADVPIHAISTDPRLLAPLRADGWADGLLPPPQQTSFSAARFLTRFLHWYSAAGR